MFEAKFFGKITGLQVYRVDGRPELHPRLVGSEDRENVIRGPADNSDTSIPAILHECSEMSADLPRIVLEAVGFSDEILACRHPDRPLAIPYGDVHILGLGAVPQWTPGNYHSVQFFGIRNSGPVEQRGWNEKQPKGWEKFVQMGQISFSADSLA